MSNLIDRQAAIDHWRLIIDATSTDSRYNMGFVDGLEFCISHLSTMPSEQPEIIRCKDCTKCQIDTVFHDYWCDGRKVWKNHYCGYAERR